MSDSLSDTTDYGVSVIPVSGLILLQTVRWFGRGSCYGVTGQIRHLLFELEGGPGMTCPRDNLPILL